jgi:hypothetical protein
MIGLMPYRSMLSGKGIGCAIKTRPVVFWFIGKWNLSALRMHDLTTQSAAQKKDR